MLPSKSDQQSMGGAAETQRTDFALGRPRLMRPLQERLGARILDASTGAVELPLTPYVSNTLGALQGGALATLVDLASESAGRAAGAASWVTTDFTIHYLALGRSGPLRSRARLLRLDPASALVRVEVHDAGADDRLIAVATCTAEALG